VRGIHDRAGARWRALAATTLVASALLGAGCVSLTPGIDAPKSVSTALATPEETGLGRAFAAQAAQHPGQSGFDLLVDGPQSFVMRLEIAARAERTLDLQYFLLQEDDTGKLVLEALLQAADRGVRVRILVDDGKPFDGGAALRPLAAHPNIEIRVFNPWVVRRELSWLRWAEFMIGSQRLNYRMHNKLFIADNAVAITGGRNIGDPYFQASSEHNLGDFDLTVVGPMVRALSKSFDLYWNDKQSIPVGALPSGEPSTASLEKCRAELDAHNKKMLASPYVQALPKRDRLAGLIAGTRSFEWASAALAYDPPDKAEVERDGKPGALVRERVASVVAGTQSELILVSPYLVPGEREMAQIHELRSRGVRVRVLTNSLASTDMPIAHAGYVRYRGPLLAEGCELYEVRSQPGKPEAHGLVRSGSSGAFGLHAKVFVIDRRQLFVGSMNFDQRSFEVNTEIGIIIDSPRLAQQVAARFESIVEPANSYRLAFSPEGRGIMWIAEEGGRSVRYDAEPEVDPGRIALVSMLSLLPLDPML
jgi:putative cardiolipin synthase